MWLQTTSQLPQCKYGADCYQQNPEHLRKFSHPPAHTTDKTTSPSKTDSDKHAASEDFVPSDKQVLS